MEWKAAPAGGKRHIRGAAVSAVWPAHRPALCCSPLMQVAIADMIFDVLKVAWGKFEASVK